jgi:murein DD-endopeptidase MepM/ murein hydrolase activator NlpD
LERINVVLVVACLTAASIHAAAVGPPTREQIIRDRIQNAEAVIEADRFDKVYANPFLVSAIYYSNHALAQLADSKAGPARIVTAIHRHLTSGFREKYMTWLDETARRALPQAEREPLVLPLAKFGYVYKMSAGHRDAIDLVTPEGTPVLSMTRGIVVLAENGWKSTNDLSTSSEMGGNTVIVYSPDERTFFRYAHLRQSIVKAGDTIARGQQIGFVGHTGKRAMRRGHGRHLHLEMNRWDPETGTTVSVHAPELKTILDSLRQRA